MNIILLSGGSGKRLWPLSNEVRSKQFIKLFKHGDERESMLERVYRQIRTVDSDATVTIATSKTQVAAIHNQLGENVSVCVEPMRRDTFPAIALALAFLHDIENVPRDESVVVCPVDPYVDDSYYEAVQILGEMAGKKNLTLMGIEPSYPSEKYGYIIPESTDKVSDVKEFKEKPDKATAEKYLKQGTLWNAGFFALSSPICWTKHMSLLTSPITTISLTTTHPQEIIKDGLTDLIKFIDAKKDLSVQVHPSDEYAKEHEHGQLGKFEMWYVIDADPGAKLVYGFKRKVTRRQVRDSIGDGSIEKYLQYVPVHRGDVFFIKPGTVHAIGGGILLAEIHESSNLTYRLYDYNRTDKNGKKRVLHIAKALDVINLGSSAEPRQPIRTLKYKPGYASELIGRCKYFEVERVLINTERVRNMAEIQTGSESLMSCFASMAVPISSEKPR